MDPILILIGFCIAVFCECLATLCVLSPYRILLCFGGGHPTARPPLHHGKLLRVLLQCFRIHHQGKTRLQKYREQNQNVATPLVQTSQLQIPIRSVVKVSKEKTAKFIPNAVGLATAEEKHVFGSLLSRDSTFKFLTLVWKRAMRDAMMGEVIPPQVESDIILEQVCEFAGSK